MSHRTDRNIPAAGSDALIEAKKFDADGGVTISRAALALEAEVPLVALGSGGRRSTTRSEPQERPRPETPETGLGRDAAVDSRPVSERLSSRKSRKRA